MIDKNIYQSRDIKQMGFEDRLDYYKNNDMKLNKEPKEISTIYFF